MPHSPGTSASFSLVAFTVMSQVLVPMILTSVPGWMPAPMAPRCAGVPTGKPVFFAHSAVNPPALESTGWTRLVNRSRKAPSFGSRRARNSWSG